MGLANYSELKQSIITWSHRSDLDLLIDDFIKIAETEMFNHPLQSLRLREMEQRATASADTASRYLALPDGFRFMRRLRLDVATGRQDLIFRSPEELIVNPATGKPGYFTVTSQIEFDRTPDSTYTIEMQYLADVTPLTALSPTNTVLTNHPQVYLYGALWVLFRHVDESDESDKYYKLFSQAIIGANKQDKKGRFGPAPMMRIEGSTP